MSHLRVCHCVDNLAACGAQQVVRHLVTNLDRDRFEPLVYAFADGPLRGVIERAGVPVRLFRRRVPKLDPGLIVRIGRALRQDGVDILHMHLFGACLHGTLGSALSGVRRIVTLHCDREDNALQRWGWPVVFAAADAVIAVSRQACESMRRGYPTLRGKASVIVNGIDVGALAPTQTKQQARRSLGLPEDRPLIGAVGRLAAAKGHEVLLAALAEARRRLPDIRLLVVGDGDRLATLREMGDSLGLNGSVRFLGPRTDVPQLLTAMDVCVMSSWVEGLPLVVLEAMAAGTPVVATAVGGIPEVVRHEQSGLLVPAGDVHQLARAICRVLVDSPLAARLTREALATVRERHDVRRMAREHEALYDRVMTAATPLALGVH